MRQVILFLILTVSTSIGAYETSESQTSNLDNQHVFGLSGGPSAVIFKGDGDETNGGTFAGIFYQYQLNKVFSFNTKLYTGSDGASGGKVSGLQLNLKPGVSFLDNWNVYGLLGLNLYSTKVDQLLNGDSGDGVGFVGGLGLEYKADRGYVLGVNAEYFTAGDINIAGVNFSVGYSF